MQSENDATEREVELARIRVRKLETSQDNRDAILAFTDFCIAEGLSNRRVIKHTATISTLAKRLGMDLRSAGRQDIQALIQGIEASDYSAWTKHDFKVTLKKFYRWLRGTEEYPDEVRWIRSSFKNGQKKLPGELITQDEVRALIAAAPSTRDRAMIAMLYESGCRIGEILSLRMKQVQGHPYGLQITVNGKTGTRRIPLVASVPYLTAWMNEHPRPNEKESPLWPTHDCRAARLCYNRFSSILQATALRAGIKKPVNPHNFRHSRATHLAVHMTEAQMKEYFGWVQGSDMASIYVHLSGRDIDNVVARINNIAIPEESTARQNFTLRSCSRCKLDNPPANRLCSRCGAILDEATARIAMTQELDRNRADGLMDRLILDEEFRSLLERKLKEFASALPRD